MSDMVMAAMHRAHARHAGETRKYSGLPYIVHPAEVAGLVASVPHDPDMLCMAWMHDLIEHKHETVASLTEAFHEEIAWGVDFMTNSFIGPRIERMAMFRNRLRGAGGRVHTVKAADIVSNTRGLLTAYSLSTDNDRKFLKLYAGEKLAEIDALYEGNPDLLMLGRRNALEFLKAVS